MIASASSRPTSWSAERPNSSSAAGFTAMIAPLASMAMTASNAALSVARKNAEGSRRCRAEDIDCSRQPYPRDRLGSAVLLARGALGAALGARLGLRLALVLVRALVAQAGAGVLDLRARAAGV